MDILDTTCLKNNPFDSLSSNILSMFFNLIWKVVYYGATCRTFKAKAEKIKKSTLEKKIPYISKNWTFQFLYWEIFVFKEIETLKRFLIFREIKLLKSIIFPKESFPYILENKNPKQIHYISGNGTFLHFTKLLMFQEVTFQARKIKKPTLKKFLIFRQIELSSSKKEELPKPQKPTFFIFY